MFGWIRRRRSRRWVHPSTHEIFKLLPNNPPVRGDTVLVDGERCRVIRSRVTWEGLHWTILGVLVEPLSSDPA